MILSFAMSSQRPWPAIKRLDQLPYGRNQIVEIRALIAETDLNLEKVMGAVDGPIQGRVHGCLESITVSRKS